MSGAGAGSKRKPEDQGEGAGASKVPKRMEAKKTILPFRKTYLRNQDSPNLFQNISMGQEYARFRETIVGEYSKNNSLVPERLYNEIPAGFLSDKLNPFNVHVVINKNRPYEEYPHYQLGVGTEQFFLEAKGSSEENKFRERLNLIQFDPSKPTLFFTCISNLNVSANKFIDGHAILCVYFPIDKTLDLVATYKVGKVDYPQPENPVIIEPDSESDAEKAEDQVSSETREKFAKSITSKDDDEEIAQLKINLSDENKDLDQNKTTRAYKVCFKTVIEKLYGSSEGLIVKQPVVFLPKEINLQIKESQAIGHCAGWSLVLAKRLTETAHREIIEQSRSRRDAESSDKPKLVPTPVTINDSQAFYWKNATFRERMFYYRGMLYRGLPPSFEIAWNILRFYVNKSKGGRRTRKIRRNIGRRRKTSRRTR